MAAMKPQLLLASVGAGAIESVVERAIPRRARKKRDTIWRPHRFGEMLARLAAAVLDRPGPPLQLMQIVRSCALDRNQAYTGLELYAVRDALAAFVAKLLATRDLGGPLFVHLGAVESGSMTQAVTALGYHGPRPPVDPTPEEVDMAKAGKLVYLLASVVTDRERALVCSVEPVPQESWRRRSWRARAMAVAPTQRRPGEDERTYLARKFAEYAAQIGQLVGRPADRPVPHNLDDLLRGLLESIRIGEEAVGEHRQISGVPITGGWLVVPPSSPAALGFAPLAASLRPLRTLRDAGGWPLLDLCAASQTPSTDLRSIEWSLVQDDTAFSGADLHRALLADQEPWVDVTDWAPVDDGLRWHVARGLAQQSVHRERASLVAMRDPRGRSVHGLVRMCLDPLDSPGSLRRALAVARADSVARSAAGSLQVLKEEIDRVGALHVQLHSTAREPFVSLALMAVDSVIAAECVDPESAAEPQIIGEL